MCQAYFLMIGHNHLVAETVEEDLSKDETVSKFGHTTAKIAAWNLAGFNPISDEKLEKQVEGLAILDAEVVTLVEVKPFAHMP